MNPLETNLDDDLPNPSPNSHPKYDPIEIDEEDEDLEEERDGIKRETMKEEPIVIDSGEEEKQTDAMDIDEPHQNPNSDSNPNFNAEPPRLVTHPSQEAFILVDDDDEDDEKGKEGDYRRGRFISERIGVSEIKKEKVSEGEEGRGKGKEKVSVADRKTVADAERKSVFANLQPNSDVPLFYSLPISSHSIYLK